MPHTVEEAADFMSKLDDLMGPSFSSAPDGAEKRIGSNKPIASTEPDEKFVLKSVSATDGSAAISTSTKVKYLVVYFVFNLGLTLFNKDIMIAVCHFVYFLISFWRDFVEAGNVLLETLLFRVVLRLRALALSAMYHCYDSFYKRSFNTDSRQFMRLIATGTFADLFL